MKNSEEIARSLNLDEEDILLAKLIGLLHDIGRFYQLENYHTVNDKKTIDHAEYGVNILKKDNYINKYTTNKTYQDIITTSILNHNKIDIDNNLKDKKLLFSKIIRDADKLDILYIIGNNPNFNKITEVTPKVKELFFSNETLPFSLIESEGDRVLIYLCYIFNVEYPYTINKIKERKLYETIYNKLDNKEILQEYFDYVYKYIDERMITC